MSMTRDEAIELLNEQYKTCKRIYDCSADQRKSYPNVPQFMEALGMALTSLRPITREQVEKMRGSGGWETVPDKDFVDTAGRQVYHLHCPHCGFFWRETGHAKYFRFCPACGAPMTDKAVDMVMERLEALYEET